MMKPLRLLFTTLFFNLFLSPLASRCNPIIQTGFAFYNIYKTDSASVDTISIVHARNLSIDSVSSMTTDVSAKYAYVQMNNGLKYVIAIPDDLRKRSDSIREHGAAADKKKQFSYVDTVKIDDKSFTGVGTESEFPGGLKAWYQFMGKTLIYPDEAVADEIQGQVILKFIVDKDGKISDIVTESGPLLLRKAAVAMLRKSPDWTPATLNGINVKSYKTQPVNFKLEVDGKNISSQSIPPPKPSINYTGLDTLHMEEMKKLSMNDVDSMIVADDRSRAFVKLKNGHRYIVIISDSLRKESDSKYSVKNKRVGQNESNAEYDKTFTKVEIESEYPGGIAVWQHFLYKNMIYPSEAESANIQGQVVLRFVVDTEGKVSDIEVVSGPSSLQDEAVRLIKKSGKWVPAVQNGYNVKSYKTQAIDFKLASRNANTDNQ